MTLNELKIAVLDEIDAIINSPVVNPEEVKAEIARLFEEYESGKKGE